MASSYVTKIVDVETWRNKGLRWVEFAWAGLGGAVACVIVLTIFVVVAHYSRLLLAVTLFCSLLAGIVIAISALGTNANSTFDKVGAQFAEGMKDKDKAMMPAPKSLPLDRIRPMNPEEGAPGKDEPTVRVRESFPETLLWKPELITDDQGHATLDLELADSITTWRLASSAVSADGRLGGAQIPIKVFQPFFVDLYLPPTLTRGDEVSVPVVVYNYLDKAQTVELKLDAADWFERMGSSPLSIELAANEVRSFAYRLRVNKVGTQHLQVTARGQGIADAIKREIEVVPDGKKFEHVITDRLHGDIQQTINIPEQSVPDSYKLIVKVYPGVFSQVLEGTEGMLRLPGG